jgi:hypothetical protein
MHTTHEHCPKPLWGFLCNLDFSWISNCRPKFNEKLDNLEQNLFLYFCKIRVSFGVLILPMILSIAPDATQCNASDLNHGKMLQWSCERKSAGFWKAAVSIQFSYFNKLELAVAAITSSWQREIKWLPGNFSRCIVRMDEYSATQFGDNATDIL